MTSKLSAQQAPTNKTPKAGRLNQNHGQNTEQHTQAAGALKLRRSDVLVLSSGGKACVLHMHNHGMSTGLDYILVMKK